MSKTNYNIQLTGYVGGYDFNRGSVTSVLEQNAGKPVNVLIDSLGGSLATALSIASAFHNHGDVTVHFVGMNASAATIASLGAKRVTMDSSAMYLAHKCSMQFFEWASLNADQLQETIDKCEQMKNDLEKMDANVARMYARKCKKDTKALLDLMKVGGWLTAQEALEWGFVDELTSFDEDSAPMLTDANASALAAQGIPLPNIAFESKDSAFAKFLSSLAAFFTPKTEKAPESNTSSQTPSLMKKTFTVLCSLLAVEAFTFADNSCALTEDQFKAIDDELAKKQKTIEDLTKECNDLKAEVADLKQKPGDTTSHVVNDKHDTTPQGEKTEEEIYMETYNAANALMQEIM